MDSDDRKVAGTDWFVIAGAVSAVSGALVLAGLGVALLSLAGVCALLWHLKSD